MQFIVGIGLVAIGYQIGKYGLGRIISTINRKYKEMDQALKESDPSETK